MTVAFGSLFPTVVELTHFHLFCGIGGGAIGFNNGSARVGHLRAAMRCVGGIDSDADAIEDFTRRAGAPGTCRDLFDAEQYTEWHGHAPPDDWHEATPADIRRAVVGGRVPDIVFTSPPCKGFSGLQNPTRARSRKYSALNRLTVRGLWLLLEAFKDDPVPLIILENVPRIQHSGPELLDQIDALLECAGYAVAHTVHDAGEVGGLGQRRKRFLLVARHRAKVPPFLYEAPRQRIRTVGEVLEELPLPETTAARIHRLPRIEWKTWMRLALVQAGKDWRSLQDLEIGDDGMVRGFRLLTGEPTPLADPRATRDLGRYEPYGVTPWGDPAHTITSQAAPGAGPYSVADPRVAADANPDARQPGSPRPYRGSLGVLPWDAPSGAVPGESRPTNGAFSVADPRTSGWGGRGKGRISGWGEEAGTVIAASHAATGAYAVADPRLPCDVEDRQTRRFCDVYHVVRWDEAAGCVTGATGNARPNIADPRPARWTEGRETWQNGGHYGVVDWSEPSPTVVGHAKADRGRWSVADPRRPAFEPTHKPERPPLIIALDGTYHRPFTTLELGALQGYPWHWLLEGLAGDSDSEWREHIGNLVPPPAAQAFASTMAETLLMARLEINVPLHTTAVWVRPLATALSIDPPAEVA